MMDTPSSQKARSLVIQFHEDHFTYDAQRRGFFLEEPDTLLGDRITRLDVTKYRLSEGWEPVTTVKLDDRVPPGVIDIWTKSESS